MTGFRRDVDVLVLAAFEPELAPLQALLTELPLASPGRIVVARTVGIGLPAAAAGAAAHLAELRPAVVVLVGTCGAYVRAESPRSEGAESGPPLAIGDVVVAGRLRLVDSAAIAGHSEFPGPMATDLSTSAPLSASLAAFAPPGAQRAHVASCVATTLAITVDDDTAVRVALATGADVEHLEAHGVATACAAVGVPFAAVLGVANYVGARGRAEWLACHRDAEVTVGEHVARWLRR